MTIQIFRKCIEQSAQEATITVVQDDGKQKLFFDNGIFIREFRRRWAYNNNIPSTLEEEWLFGSFAVVFIKNLSVTDILLGELTSLLRKHVAFREGSTPGVDFFDSRQYTKFLTNTWTTIFRYADEYREETFLNEAISESIELFITNYFDIFSRIVVLDILYTTASIHVPPSMSVDLRQVVYQSGYIQSAGPIIYIRNISKSELPEIQMRIRTFVELHPGMKFYLTPYADEYFEEYEKENSVVSTRNGLDGIRINLRKHYLGDNTLRAAFRFIQREFPDNLKVADGLINYRDERTDSVNVLGCTKECTIWAIIDSDVLPAVMENMTAASNQTYLIFYAQYFYNANILVILKERKPSWSAPITLPHTLSSAMLNITYNHLHNDRPIIVDPFCGTGTSIIDAYLRWPNANIIGFDKNPLMPMMVRDNIEFFSLNFEGVDGIRSRISSLEKGFGGDIDHFPRIEEFNRAYSENLSGEANVKSNLNRNIRIVGQLVTAIVEVEGIIGAEDPFATFEYIIENGFGESGRKIYVAENYNLEDRLVFSILWRALFSNIYNISGNTASIKFDTTMAKHMESAKNELRELCNILRMIDTRGGVVGSGGPFEEVVASHLYSKASVLSPTFMRSMLNSFKRDERIGKLISPDDGDRDTARQYILTKNGGVSVCCVEDSIPVLCEMENMIDLIVTDPPYSVNVNEESLEMMPEMIVAFVRALKVGGQLIMALPSYSKNGKSIPYATTGEFVVREFIQSARVEGKRIIRVVETFPSQSFRFMPPFYWNANSGVSRNVVHFIVE